MWFLPYLTWLTHRVVGCCYRAGIPALNFVGGGGGGGGGGRGGVYVGDRQED